MIRLAVISDLDRLQDMGARFFGASGLDRWFHYKPRCFSRVCADFMASDKTVLLVGEGQMGAVAMASAMAYPVWFDHEHLTAQEVFWWVEPQHRGGSLGTELRQGLEDWARNKGCLTMEMGALEASRPEILAQLYERKGYGAKERIFCKRLVA
jgi:GNAT superfamily N-acetyltransferase